MALQLSLCYPHTVRRLCKLALLFRYSAWLLHVLRDKAPPTAYDGVWAVVHRCWWVFPFRMKPWMLPGLHHRVITTMRTLFTCALNWGVRREIGVYCTPTRFPTNILNTPLDNTPLHVHNVCEECGAGVWAVVYEARMKPWEAIDVVCNLKTPHHLGEIVRASSWATELLALYRTNDKTTHLTLQWLRRKVTRAKCVFLCE